MSARNEADQVSASGACLDISALPDIWKTDRLEQIIDAYVGGYVTEYDDGSYTPGDEERFRIKDALMGLLADPDWDAEWGKHIAKLASDSAASQQPDGSDLLASHQRLKDALEGMHTLCTLVLAGRSGKQYANIETRHGSFIHATPVMQLAEAALKAAP